ncbi:uncharacterized protein LOC133036541 [Cannabis sativa]|uniref:uncharacterized protein LOC133036541 n=1 Tax=Cannabis sativa TaxID=3483 RepID=UPI0029CA9A1D|nr:uncharacterized protein LOC133036541 [Cannabis sativa]
MRVLAWNCRGLGNAVAVRQLTAILRRSNPEVIILSETRLAEDKFVTLMHKLHFINLTYVPPVGHSGGFGIGWKMGVSCTIHEQDKNWISGTIESDPPGTKWNLLGIYGPPTLNGKEAFWTRVAEFCVRCQSPTLLLGDLNGTLADNESINYTNHGNSARYSFDLRRMVARTGLVDLGCMNGKFTWFQRCAGSIGGTSVKRARLDRALASVDWRLLFPNAVVECMTVSTSDHKPILLNTDGGARCTKAQFKYELMWGRDPRCYWVVRNAWRNQLHLNPMINMYRKLKKTKEYLQRWNKTHFRKIQQQVMEARSDVEKAESPDQVVADSLEKARSKLNEALRREEIFWRQKSRVAWLKEGDQCTKFFMASTVIRRRKNFIQTIKMENGEWVSNLKSITDLFITKFNSTFSKNSALCAPANDSLINPVIKDCDNLALISIPTDLEIETCIKSMGHDKAPGPDGMSTGFYLHHWDVIKTDLLAMVSHFFRNLDLPPCINNTNIVLIPKKDCPVGVNDFRPIALCNVNYKCISKILALRLKPLLPTIISPAQTAFVHGRLIAENTAVAREIVHSMMKKKGKKGFMMIKLDMEKAYDKMDWGFILNTLQGLGFHPTFTKWVEKCITIQRMGLLINGSVQGTISPSCGLRQGDPLSPALFIIAADVLSRLIMKRTEAGIIQGFKITRGGPAVTHLMFADDVILFGKASLKEAKGFLKCLEEYCACSGQAVNYHKSTVHFTSGVSLAQAREISELLNMKRMKKDATYLGLPLFRSLNRSKDLHFLVERVMQRVKSWKTRLLSKAGRACLIQAVGSSLATYVAATDPIPLKIAHRVDRSLRDFWWGDTEVKRKMHLINWSTLCQSKLRGGLGFRSLEVVNKAFMTKWAWKALTEKNSLWSLVINAKYVKGKNFLDLDINSSDSGMWKAVLQARPILQKSICKKIGNGRSTSIWFDPWVPASNRTPTPLKDVSFGVSWVNQFLLPNNQWNVGMVREWFNQVDVNEILNIDMSDEGGDDSWVWLGEKNGAFSIRSAYRSIKGGLLDNVGAEHWKWIWNSPLHSRLKLLWWQLYRDALPTKDKLASVFDGISNLCTMCNDSHESSLHLFWSCPFAKAIWFKLVWGIRTEMVSISTWAQWMDWFKIDVNRPPNVTFDEFMVHTLCVVEEIWKERNRRTIGEKKEDMMRIIDIITLKIKDHVMASLKTLPDVLSWTPPPPKWKCCNSDVAILNSESVISAVLRDEWGNVVAIKTAVIQVTNPMLAEAHAVCLAADLSISLGETCVMFQSDNLNVVQEFAVSTSSAANFRLQCAKERFMVLCSKFIDWGIIHISRKCNFMAHNVARWAARLQMFGNICTDMLPSAVLDDFVEWDPGSASPTLTLLN